MKKLFVFVIPALCFSLMIACSGNNSDKKNRVTAEVKDIVDSNKNAEDMLRSQIVGSWTAIETGKGETLVFEKDGNYSGYDGREQYKGTWNLKGRDLYLSLIDGSFRLDIQDDTLYLDSKKYMRQQPALTDGSK